eukprot:TRINITY_DN7029_c0_g1_i1.p1 TRINITY_DN7029_c0_g1~~TRINITY_DN7029_c0_g1_i1.p1  ORF type:complete len:477 (-),score=85.90 TRINITY_DN7029_c0_g1_i1:22-1278(-)
MKQMDQILVQQLKFNAHGPEDEKALIVNHLIMSLSHETHYLGKSMTDFLRNSWWSHMSIEQLCQLGVQPSTLYLSLSSPLIGHSTSNSQENSPLINLDSECPGEESFNSDEKGDSDDVLVDMVHSINFFRSDLLSTIIAYYLTFSSLKIPNKYAKEAIDAVLFPFVYNKLFALYKLKFQAEDTLFRQRVEEIKNIISPIHLGSNKRFWLSGKITCRNGESGQLHVETASEKSYQLAINTLSSLPFCLSPEQKMNTICATLKSITSCVDLHWKTKLQSKPKPALQISNIIMSADDLVPIFTYVVIMSGIQFPFSESKMIEDFLPQNSFIGEDGYMLVTFNSALSYACRLNRSQLQQTAAKMLNEHWSKSKKEKAKATTPDKDRGKERAKVLPNTKDQREKEHQKKEEKKIVDLIDWTFM